MPTFLLIRHGENDYVTTGRLAGRLPGVHLNDNGRKQAQTLAERLTGAPVKAIYSSPMERTLETAEPIAHALSLEITPLPGLIELDLGEWQNKKLKGLSRLKVWRQVQQAPASFRFPGGESFLEAQTRFCSTLLDLAARHEPKDLLICVTHADPIRLGAAYFLGVPLDLFQRIHVSPASVSTFWIGAGVTRILNLNVDYSICQAPAPPPDAAPNLPAK